jgi:hypothetical protein
MEIRIDEEFKGLMPPLVEDEYKLLEESLKAEGCREPIILWHGVIIDGYHRYEICQKNDIKFKTISKTFDNKDQVKLWIIKNQLGRRNLTDYDRGRLVLQLKPIISEKRKRGRPKKEIKPNLADLQTRDEIAKIADLSHGTIDKIEKIENEGSEELKEKARKGEISIDAAYKATKPKPRKIDFEKEVTEDFKRCFEAFLPQISAKSPIDFRSDTKREKEQMASIFETGGQILSRHY